LDENGDLWTTKFCCFTSYYLEHFVIDPMCIDHYTWTVSEWTKDNAVSLGLWDMTRRFRDCLGPLLRLAPYKLSYLLTYLLRMPWAEFGKNEGWAVHSRV